MKPEKIVVDQLIHDLQHRPEDFQCGQCTMKDKKTGYEYWIANCFFDASVYAPYTMPLGFVQGWRFYRALNKWKAAAFLAAPGI